MRYVPSAATDKALSAFERLERHKKWRLALKLMDFAREERGHFNTLFWRRLTEDQHERVRSEWPKDGIPCEIESHYELAAYRMPNGSRFVTLVDGSDATWEAYCAECNARLPESKPTNPLVP